MGWFRSKTDIDQKVEFTAIGGKFATFLNVNGTMVALPTELTDGNAYELATKVAEIFIPIDLVAGKVQKLMCSLHVVNDKGEEIKTPANIKKILARPNPYYTMSDIAYNGIFSLMADGNRYLYAHSLSPNITQDNITGLFILEPSLVDIIYKADKSKYFDALNVSDMVKEYKYSLVTEPIHPDRIKHDRYSFITGSGSFTLKAQSPLYAAQQNINNILAAYSARYNVFVNNGAAIILTPKAGDKTFMNTPDPATREAISDEVNQRLGLVGCKSIKSISSIPLDSINTLATIKDLQPYEECREDMYLIGGVYEIDKDLLPGKEGTTFTNKEVAEAKLWNDVVIPFANDFCDSLTDALRLKGGRFAIKANDEGFLQANRKVELEADKIEIENLSSLSVAGIDVTETMKQIAEKYGQK